jgi:hypothetical protein
MTWQRLFSSVLLLAVFIQGTTIVEGGRENGAETKSKLRVAKRKDYTAMVDGRARINLY